MAEMQALEALTEKFRTTAATKRLAGKRLKFVIEGQGIIAIDGSTEPPRITNDDVEADCDVVLDAQTAAQLMARELDPTRAFMTGKLRFKGDLSVAMRIAPLLRQAAG